MELPLSWPERAPECDGIRLRPLRDTDVAMLRDLATDPYLPLIGTLPGDADEEEALGYLARQHDRLVTGAGWSFCVARADSDEPLGQAGLWTKGIEQGRATAGYAVAPRARGHGVAARALRALTEFAWTVPEVHRVELYIEPWNAASRRTAERAGYRREGLLRSHQVIGGRRVDMELFAALRRTD